MTDGLLSEGIHGFISRLSEIAGNISVLEPMVREELGHMDDQTFWKSVCHNIISDTLETVKEGTHLYQCPWRNRDVFDSINNPHHYMIAKDASTPERMVEVKPEILVNIARLARFSMKCPYASTERCPRRNFRFLSDKERGERERI
jgi:hypothetical protein